MNWLRVWNAMSYNKPLKYVPATKSVASTGLADARRLAGRYATKKGKYICSKNLDILRWAY